MSPYAVITDEVRQRQRERSRAHYLRNRERILARHAERAKTEGFKEWRRAHQEKVGAAQAEKKRLQRIADHETVRARERAWDEAHPGARAEYARQYRQRNPDKRRARDAVRQAVKRGRLERPAVCSACRATCRAEAHHHLGYAREHRLDVQWFCKPCHIAADLAQKDGVYHAR